jgi:UDP-3-O-[3-hydroxymyristoyl] glucosamine N-acyltransferase
LKLSLKEIAKIAGGQVVGDGAVMISGINTLDVARSGEISFFIDRRYLQALEQTRASAIIVGKKNDLYNGPQLIFSNPGLGYARVAELFASSDQARPGVSEQALVHESSIIAEDASVYPMVYIGENVVVGKQTVLFPGVFLGDGVKIGNHTVVHPNVSILNNCLIGNHVIISAGTVIGSDGFGYVRDGSVSVKIPQLGIVRIDDNVEIGAGNTIDRAALGTTWIKRGVKTDNQVHIAHNVVIGEDTIIVAQAGISGSARVGREVVIGGQVGLVDHIEIGDRVIIGSQSGVSKSIPAGQIRTGSPAISHRVFLKAAGLFAKLPQMVERLRRLEKRMDKIDANKRQEKE